MADETKKSDKKLKTVEAKTGEVVQTKAPKILASMKVTKDDLVSIAVAKRERDLMSQRATFDKQIKDTKSLIDDVTAKLNKKAKELVESEFKPQIGAAVIALQAAGFSSASSDISFSLDLPTQKVNFTLAVRSDDGRHSGGGFQRSGKKEFTAEMVTMYESIESLTKTLTKVQEESLACRRELGNLATTERQAKAALAQHVLELSDEGGAMLEALEDVKQLPLSM